MVSSLTLVFTAILGVLALVHGTYPGDAAPRHPIHAAAHGHAHAPAHGAPPRLGTLSPPATPAPTVPIDEPRRRLFGVRDVWSWLSDKQRSELLQQTKAKLTATQHTTTNQATPTPPARRLKPKSPDTPPEMGSMFHVLRFFANRVGDVNDDAFTEQERLAALRSSSSSSSSSSMDTDAVRAAALDASLAKAAQAYGLTSPPTASAAPPLPTTTSPSSPTPPPTAKSLLTTIEW